MKQKIDKVKGKTDATTAKVVQPLEKAQQKVMSPMHEAQETVNNAQNQAMAPVHNARGALSNAQNRVLSPVTNLKSTADAAKNKMMAPVVGVRHSVRLNEMQLAALKSQLGSAERLTDGVFQKDSLLRTYGLDALASNNGQSLRLIGTVKNAADRARAEQLAARNFPGSIVNEIRVVPAAAKMSVQDKLRKAIGKSAP